MQRLLVVPASSAITYLLIIHLRKQLPKFYLLIIANYFYLCILIRRNELLSGKKTLREVSFNKSYTLIFRTFNSVPIKNSGECCQSPLFLYSLYADDPTIKVRTFQSVEESRLYYDSGTDFSKLLSDVLKVQKKFQMATPAAYYYAEPYRTLCLSVLSAARPLANFYFVSSAASLSISSD